MDLDLKGIQHSDSSRALSQTKEGSASGKASTSIEGDKATAVQDSPVDVEITQESRLLQKLEATLNTSDIDESSSKRVSEIASSIEDGSYKPDYNQVAQRIIDAELQM